MHCIFSLPVALYFFAACCRCERGAHAGDDLPVPQPAADAEEVSPGAGSPDHHHRGGDGHQVSLLSLKDGPEPTGCCNHGLVSCVSCHVQPWLGFLCHVMCNHDFFFFCHVMCNVSLVSDVSCHVQPWFGFCCVMSCATMVWFLLCHVMCNHGLVSAVSGLVQPWFDFCCVILYNHGLISAV